MSVISVRCYLDTRFGTQRFDSRLRTSLRLRAWHTHDVRYAKTTSQTKQQRSNQSRALPCICCVRPNSQNHGSAHVEEGSVSVVFLAGGTGTRMGASMPKQYLQLLGQPIAMHSLNTFGSMREVGEIVVVCNPSYRNLFQQYLDQLPPKVKHSFALPGIERQDSVYSGLQAVSTKSALVAVHDSARPLLQAEDAAACMLDALQTGAAVLGVPVKPTIKEVDSTGMVIKTLIRASLWEVQTPQVIKPELLKEGFQLVQQQKLEVTDDVSIIEAMGRPVKITKGSYTNIKVTTPDDMLVAEGFLISKESHYSAVGSEGVASPSLSPQLAEASSTST